MESFGEVTETTDSSFKNEEGGFSGQSKDQRSKLFGLLTLIAGLKERRLQMKHEREGIKGQENDILKQITSVNEERLKLEQEMVGTKGLKKVELSMEIQKLNVQRSKLEQEMVGTKGLKAVELSMEIQKLNVQRSELEQEMGGTKGLKKVELSMEIQKLNVQRSELEKEIESTGNLKDKLVLNEHNIEMIEQQIWEQEEVKAFINSRLQTMTEDATKQTGKYREHHNENKVDDEENIENEPEACVSPQPPKDQEFPDDQHFGLLFQRLNLENEIVIEGMFPKTFSCRAVPWNSANDRLSMSKDDSCPKGFNLETDIFYIKESKTDFPLDEDRTPCKNMLLTITLPNPNTKDKMYNHYLGASMYQNAWHFIEPISQEGCLVFEVKQVESFCVISIVPGQNYIITPAGGKFISTLDSRIQVIFPPGAVKKETMISFKIHPMNINCITQISEEENMGVGLICDISPGFAADHLEFKKPVMVKLPLQNIQGYSYDDKTYEYCLYKREDEGSFEVTDIVPRIENEIASFEIISFSRYVAGGFSKSWDKNSRGIIVDRAQGILKRCKVLFFVGKTVKRHMHTLLECVEWYKVKATSEKRKLLGFNLISEWISKDLYLEPCKAVIAVELKGKFKMPKDSGIKQHKISFIPMAKDNYEHVEVELDDKKLSSYGIVSLFHNNKCLYDIYYDPTRSIRVATNYLKPYSIKERPKYLDDAEFFTDIGLLELAKKMDDNIIFQVCIYMKMSMDTYENIPKQSSVERKFILLQTALKQQPNGKKTQCLIKALNSAGEKSLAERVEKIWSSGKPLNTISGTYD